MQMGYSFGAIFGFCEIGERVTHQFNAFNEKLCDSNWYSFPIEIQRIYLVVLVGVQNPSFIYGFAHTVCTREAFKKVISARNI